MCDFIHTFPILPTQKASGKAPSILGSPTALGPGDGFKGWAFCPLRPRAQCWGLWTEGKSQSSLVELQGEGSRGAQF